MPLRMLTVSDLATALMIARDVPERYHGDTDTIRDAEREAKKILDTFKESVWIGVPQDSLDFTYTP